MIMLLVLLEWLTGVFDRYVREKNPESGTAMYLNTFIICSKRSRNLLLN